jgi:glycosyltransferase involved in cell wall biosynthesis
MLSRSGDWQDVGWNILTLLNNPEQRVQMGNAARQRVLNHFTVQRSAQKTAALFRRLLKRQQRPQQVTSLMRPERT